MVGLYYFIKGLESFEKVNFKFKTAGPTVSYGIVIPGEQPKIDKKIKFGIFM